MSTLATNAITDASGGNTATINSYTPTESNMAGRNRIINGDMRIDQRNAGAAQNNLASGWVYTADRWGVYSNTSSRFNSQQNKGAVTPPAGFKNYLGVSVNTGYSVGASDYNMLAQPIEGFNTADLGFGASGASTVTLSFFVYSSVTGTHSGFLGTNSLVTAYPFTFTVSSANTWTQVSVTITGSTSGAWVGATNGLGLYVGFNLGNGANHQTASANAWNSSAHIQPTGSVSIVATTGATFYITGVQLEAGSVATPFEYRQFGQELALCQRYYAKMGANPSGGASYQAYASGCNQSNNTNQNIALVFPQYMRASPTIAYSGNIGVTTIGLYATISSIASAYTGVSSSLIQTTSPAIGSAGQGVVLLSNADPTAFISLTAEL